MATYTFQVRPGFAVTLGAPNSNGSGSTVYAAGSNVTLSDDQYESHAHKLHPTDSGSTTKVTAGVGILHTPKANTV